MVRRKYSKEYEVRKTFQRTVKAFGKMDFALVHLKRVQAVIFMGKDQKGKGKGGAYPQTGFSASENLVEEGQGHPWESDDWYSNFTDNSSSSACKGTTAWHNSRHCAWKASVPLDLAHHPTHVVLDLGCTRSIGSGKAINMFQKYALYYGITTEF